MLKRGFCALLGVGGIATMIATGEITLSYLAVSVVFLAYGIGGPKLTERFLPQLTKPVGKTEETPPEESEV